jgi:hypothetical protein
MRRSLTLIAVVNHWTVTASTRWETFSNDLAFWRYPVRRAMTAQEPAMATANQIMPLSGQPNRFSFHMETNDRTTRTTARNTISRSLKALNAPVAPLHVELGACRDTMTANVA